MNVITAIKTKRAVRHFSDKPLPSRTVYEILNSGRLAQSSKNMQPWDFIAVKDQNTLNQLASCGKYAEHLKNAAIAIAIVSSVTWAFDIGQAAACMQLAAWELGVSSCVAKMHDSEHAKMILGVPSDRYLEIVLSFGYAISPHPIKGKIGGRRRFEEVIHWEHW
jgi:nitroreductase